MNKPVLLYVVNTWGFFLSHRLPIALKAVENGYTVHVACNFGDRNELSIPEDINIHLVNIDRQKLSLFSNALIFINILKLVYALKPNIIHLITLKPIVFGGIAARILKVPLVVVAVSGLGFLFIKKNFKTTVYKFLLSFLLRLALKHSATKVIFQNNDDRSEVLRLSGVSPTQTTIIEGSGVDLNSFSIPVKPEDTPIVILPARLLVHKGVLEFVDAAKSLKSEGFDARFVLVGNTDSGNPASVTDEKVESWCSQGIIEWWGFCRNMPEIYASSSVVVLPSYREGFPKSLIEAAAAGKPVVTTDVPGCRDAIINNETGLLVPPRNSLALAVAIRELLLDPNLRLKMGIAGRELAKNKFDIAQVVNNHMEIYAQCFKNN